MSSQKPTSKEKLQEEHKENIWNIAKRITKEGGTNSQLFWKGKRKITLIQSGGSYVILDENGNTIEELKEAKEHIAQYFENLYQAREGRPMFEGWTNEIKTSIKALADQKELRN